MRRLPYLYLTLAGLFWSLGFPLARIAMREMDSAHMILLRFAAAGIAALPFALRGRDTRALFRSPVVIAAGALYGIAFLVQFQGFEQTSITLAALLVGAMPALIAVAAWAVGERVSPAAWAGVAAATIGAAVIAGKPGPGSTAWGVALSVVSLPIFLAWLMLARRAPKASSAMAVPAVSIIIATATILPISWLMHGPPKLDISLAAWISIAFQGVLSTLAATAAWQFGAARVGSANAGVFINIEPLVGSIIGVALFGDHPTLALVLGGALIIVGSFVVVRSERAAAVMV
jgi:drug/metabolite transporter (DMT)-like permease